MNTVFRRLLGVGAPLCLMLSFGWLAASAMTQPIPPVPTDDMTAVMQAHIADKQNQPETATLNAPTAVTACVNGFAGAYPCQNIDLLAQITLPNLGSNIGPFNNAEGSDIWGWTDPQTGVEYAIMLLENGTAFVDLSDPTAPTVTAFMPSQPQTSGARYWRDAKVYKNYAYVVADGSPNNNHGLQVFDLTRLRDITTTLTQVSPDNHIDTFGPAHNIAINEDSGYAYVVGANRCSGGLLMFNLKTASNPSEVGCFSSDGYTHDVQCVNYTGPDADYADSELCFAANEDTLTVVDVTDKANPTQVARKGYAGSRYTHQGWLSPDQRFFIMNDELDEAQNGVRTRTYVWNVENVDNPQLLGWHDGRTFSIDHNLYTKGNLIYEANYRAGLEILVAHDYATADLETVAYFDVYPASDSPNFNGAWSVYPYFESGIVIVSSIEFGLFVLQPQMSNPVMSPPAAGSAQVGNTVTYEVEMQNLGLGTDVYTLTAVSSLGWPTSIDPITVSLDAQESALATVEVTIPSTATVGINNLTTVTMQSQSNAMLSDTAVLETEVELTPEAGLAFTTPITEKIGTPAAHVPYTLTLTNTGNITDTFTIEAVSPWATSLDPQMVTLASGDTAEVLLEVTVPMTVSQNQTATTQVTAVSGLDAGVSETIDLQTTAQGVFVPEAGIAFTAVVTMGMGAPNTAVTYTLTLTNSGNTTDTFTLSGSGDWLTSFDPLTVTLTSGEATTVTVQVTVAPTATDGLASETVITAVSGLDNAVTAAQTLTTTAMIPPAVSYDIYLPLIRQATP